MCRPLCHNHCASHSECQTRAARLNIGRRSLTVLLCCPLLCAAVVCLLVLLLNFRAWRYVAGLGHLAMQIIKLMKISIISMNPRQLHVSQSSCGAADRPTTSYGCYLYLLKGKFHLWIAICWRQLVVATVLVLLCNQCQWQFNMIWYDRELGQQKRRQTTNASVVCAKKKKSAAGQLSDPIGAVVLTQVGLLWFGHLYESWVFFVV